MQKYPFHLNKLIEQLKRLPGVGSKSAERFAFHLLNWSPENIKAFAQTLGETPEKLHLCQTCGCLCGDDEACYFCQHPRRTDILCVVASPKDVFALDATGEYQGLYHVLGALLSPLEGIGPERLRLDQLKNRLAGLNIREVVLALDSTLEGDATALYLKQELEPAGIHISRLAFGMPMGSSFDYVDGGTLARALSARGKF